MKIELTCSGCEAKYRVSQEYVGRKVRCKTCSNVMTVESPEEVVEDYGDLWEEEEEEDAPPPRPKKSKETFSELPPRVKKKKPVKKTPRKTKPDYLEDEARFNLIFAAVGVAAFCALLAVGYFQPDVLFWGGLVLLAVGNVATYMHSVGNDCHLLYRFIPLYSIYYTICYFSEVWHWALMRVCGGVLLIACLGVHVMHARNEMFEHIEHLDEYTLILRVGSENLPDDADEDPAERDETIHSPTVEVLRDKVTNLPWGDATLWCVAELSAPMLADEVYEGVTIEKSAETGAITLSWERYDEEDEGAYGSSEPYATTDDALPVLEAFLSGDREWRSKVKWKEIIE